MRSYRSVTAATLAILLSALAGGVFGRSALATEDRLPDHYRTFTAALGAIQANYADKVESDRLVYGAINGMLQTLDPHSSFMDPKSYAQMRERQEGRYYGLGLTIVAVDGDITVVRVFEGSPAYGKGIRRGDVIAKHRKRGREGLDERSGGAPSQGTEGHIRLDWRAPQGSRRSDSDGRDARRDHHPRGDRALHDRSADRLRAHRRLRRAHRAGADDIARGDAEARA